MFKFINGLLGAVVIVLFLKWLFPPEASDLAKQILIKILSLINDLLAMVDWPQ
jgi:hypothetical protein